MEMSNKLNELSDRIPTVTAHIQTEESTKSSLVMPFIAALGYDIFNPAEVIPEFTADVGSKKGEKVDYAIIQDGNPLILFECKCYGTDLAKSHAAQLRRYFHVTTAKIGVLTNGVVYKFYSDLDNTNIMDDKPFMILDMHDIDDAIINEVKKLTKSTFELDEMLSSAYDLRYVREIKHLISEEYKEPSAEFVRFFASQVYPKKIMPTVLESFTKITKRAFSQFINEHITDRINSAISSEIEIDKVDSDEAIETVDDDIDNGIVTTVEELEGYHIVRAILREVVDPKRVVHRDTKSYFGILLDDNNRRPICRLHFNARQKYIGLIDESKNEVRHPIDDLSDIYKYTDQIKMACGFYD